MTEEKDHYEGALLEKMDHNISVILEYLSEIYKNIIPEIRGDIKVIQKDISDIKAEQSYMRTMHIDKNRRLNNHEIRITNLEKKPAS